MTKEKATRIIELKRLRQKARAKKDYILADKISMFLNQTKKIWN